jgi:fucose permease
MFPLQGSGVFYAGYVLFQIPSNLILSRLGARTWLPFITAAWGAVATCCIFIKGKPHHDFQRACLTWLFGTAD